MHFRNRLLCGLCLAAFAMPADAATWVVTYEGTFGTTYVEDGNGGVMIDPSQFGTAFTATFTVNDSLGTLDTGTNGSYAVLGGYGADNPVLGKLTFGSTALSFGTSSGGDERFPGSSGDDLIRTWSESSVTAGSKLTYGYLSADAYLPAGTVSVSDLGKAFTSAVLPGSSGIARWSTYDYAANGYEDYFYTTLNLTNVSVGALSGAVPEPATWAMMILGFGLVGTLARRRHRATGRPAYE